ncbi:MULTISPECIES: ABC transporter permease [Kitasatospora]|uniref:Putative peptide ABC transporter permease protein n=1 Tax=Kitasatospora setae (strain ATCC 33774 / DSM 43861 / JCM 3304 / KCC A-0304 / NBRC 14216 / KM-6054) TaxID=452652 RepID=E4NJR5_KITSK|nr:MULTISPECIES: ABC transporter permease [Kitasatospora]BAJ33213.1 putative peptide ABC transporter permease protein [Kitasatospora setae KM-6054]
MRTALTTRLVPKRLRGSVGLQRAMLLAGVALTALLLLAALAAPWLAPWGHAQLQDGGALFGSQRPPGAGHPLGTTVGGYDVLARTLWATRTAVAVIGLSLLISVLPGTLLGLASGYLGGWPDRLLVGVADALYSFPSLLLAIVLSIVISGGQSSLGGGLTAAACSVAMVFVPQYFRVVRAEVLRVKAEPFVEAARVIGTGHLRIMFRHVLRNSVRGLPLILTLNAAESVLTLAGLGFLGFGIEPNAAAEWGYDLNRSVPDVTSGIWWTALAPGSAMVLTVLGVTLLGESLNDLADPRLRRRRAPAATIEVPAEKPATTGTPAEAPAETPAEEEPTHAR